MRPRDAAPQVETASPARKPLFSRPAFNLGVIIAFGLLLTGISFRQSYLQWKAYRKEHFLGLVDTHMGEVRHQVHHNLDALILTGVFFQLHEDIAVREVSEVTFPWPGFLPEFRSVMWAPITPTGNAVPAGPPDSSFDLLDHFGREFQFEIELVEPFEPGSRVSALRFWREPETMRAFARACETGRIVSSERLADAADGLLGEGVVLFLPVYDHGSPVPDDGLPHVHARGFVIGVYDIETQISTGVAPLNECELDVVLLDASTPAQLSAPTGDYPPDPGPAHSPGARRDAGLAAVRSFEIADRTWAIRCTPSAEFLADSPMHAPRGVLYGGLLLTGAIGWYVHLLTGRAVRVEQHTHQLRRHAEQLHAANQAAMAATHAKTRFLANMSHEIRTPLSAILGYTELSLDPGVSEQQRLDNTRIVHRNSLHLLTLVNEILDTSKIETGRLSLELIDADPLQIVHQVISLMRPAADEKGLTLAVERKTTIPSCIRTDPTRLLQILTNLVGNAVKFTEHGGVRVVLSIEPAPRRMLRIDVIDTGIGIESSHYDALFEAFSQADPSTTRRFGGTGLGLTISRRLAIMLGGDITVQSTPGEGSIFTLLIDPSPAAQGDTHEISATEEQPRADRPSIASMRGKPDLTGVRILIAEDGLDNQRLFEFQFHETGAEVVIVINGRQAVYAALEAMKHGDPFDVVFMDMQMPVLDGYEAARELRGAGYTRPIIALTAHAMKGDRESCLAAGCDAYVVKPIERALLLALAASWCGVADAA